jgi:hypothetical protein
MLQNDYGSGLNEYLEGLRKQGKGAEADKLERTLGRIADIAGGWRLLGV